MPRGVLWAIAIIGVIALSVLGYVAADQWGKCERKLAECNCEAVEEQPQLEE